MSMIKPYKKCQKCGVLIVSGKLCEDCKPITNADRIRQMTDEELAELLIYVDTNICNFCAAQRSNVYYDCEEESCKKSVLAWLKQEVKTDDER